MIVMMDTSTPLEVCEAELGMPCEQLCTPASNRSLQREAGRFCVDNGAFANFDGDAFMRLLNKLEPSRAACRFIAVPDVVGSARRTIEAFERWAPRLKSKRWPLAFVCQDGQEDAPIPWDDIAAVFIGGSTKWKLSESAGAIIKASRVMNCWCHVGRVNTPGRLEFFEASGADSCDGTGLARYTHMRAAVHASRVAPRLDF